MGKRDVCGSILYRYGQQGDDEPRRLDLDEPNERIRFRLAGRCFRGRQIYCLCKPRDVETHGEHRSLRYRQSASILTSLLRLGQSPSLLTNLRELVSLSKLSYYLYFYYFPFQNSPTEFIFKRVIPPRCTCTCQTPYSRFLIPTIY